VLSKEELKTLVHNSCSKNKQLYMETQESGLDKLKGFVNAGDIAMLCTLQEEEIHSRPMATSDIDEAGNIWFFTNGYAPKVDEVQNNQNITLCYSDHNDSTYVCIKGTGSLVTDRSKMEELFNPMVKAFFPKGLDDPRLALLKVEPKQAEYWDSPSSSMVRFMGMLGAAVTGKKYSGGDHGKIDL
jgi:general stress protein 26